MVRSHSECKVYSHIPVESSVILSVKGVTIEMPLYLLLLFHFLAPVQLYFPFIVMTGLEEVCVCFLACRWAAIHSHRYNLSLHTRLGFLPVRSCYFRQSEKVISHCFPSICNSIRSYGKLWQLWGKDVNNSPESFKFFWHSVTAVTSCFLNWSHDVCVSLGLPIKHVITMAAPEQPVSLVITEA